MGWATYTAQRELAFNHFAGTAYTLPLELTEFRAKGGDLKTQQQSLSAKVEIQYYGTEKIWHVTLAPINDTESELVREFLGSTADGQAFTFDPSGDADHPSRRLMTVVRADSGASEEPFNGMGGDEDMVQFGFDIRQV
jgi:hypothetical protein